MTADIVEHEVKRALDLLEGDRSEQYRYTAVLVLRELAPGIGAAVDVLPGMEFIPTMGEGRLMPAHCFENL